MMVKKIGTIKDLTKYVIFSIGVVILYTIAEFIGVALNQTV